MLLQGRDTLLTDETKLRNRIYHFATEENHAREYQPLLRRFPDRYPKNYPPGFVQELYAKRALLALAQTCRQLRVEMRPLWLSSFHARVLDEQLPEFRRTFFKQPSDLQYAPKLVEISWQGGLMVQSMILSALRLS